MVTRELRTAAIDAGSNTILLVVGQRDDEAAAGYRVIADEIEFARLGEGVDRSGRLSDGAMERGLSAFRRYVSICADLGVTKIVSSGTSALRDAANGREFLARVKDETGVEVEIIDGDREARLGFASATDELPAGTPAIVLDIGGGSAQVITGHARKGVEKTVSFQLGAVRLTERHLASDPPTKAELAKLGADVDAALAGAPKASPAAELFGVSGTCTTLAAVSLKMADYDSERIHGRWMPREEVERLQKEFCATDTLGRARMPGLHPKRADVIVAGAAVLLHVMRRYGKDGFRVADRGIRHALLREAILG